VENSGVAKATNTFTEEEGTGAFTKTYILPLVTELQIKRKFTKPGIWYKVLMRADNMHNLEDTATMEW
jgi:hypothetical protein